MLRVYIKPSCVIAIPYKKNQIPVIEKMLSVWDPIVKHYTQFLYEFQKDEGETQGALRIPLGVGKENILNVINDTGVPYTIIDDSEVYPMPRPVNLQMKLQPKNEVQRESISFLKEQYESNHHQTFLTLDVGMGKTYCTTNHLVECAKHSAMIISYNLAYQWSQRISQYTNALIGTDVVTIVGTQFLYDVIKSKVRPTAAFYLVTIDTMVKFMDMYGDDKLQIVAEKLGIGTKIFDEAHMRYLRFNRIDVNMQVKHTIYLTATPGRSRTQEDRMYCKIYGTIPSFGEWTSKLNRHYIIKYVTMDSHSTAADRMIFKGPRGLSTVKYSRYLIDKYGESVYKMIAKYIMPILEEDRTGKALIIMDWLQDIDSASQWFKKTYPQYTVGTYCQNVPKKEKEAQLERRIIFGTTGSMQNGKDISQLRCIFALTQFSSQIVARQLLGRLRPIKDKYVFYFDLADRSVPDILGQRRHRNIVFQDRAANDISEDYVDLNRL